MASVFISSPAEVVVIDSRTRAGTVTLPLTNSIPYRVINFKDQYGSFSNSTFTISTQVGESFDDGATSKTFSNAFSYLSLYSVSSKWMVMNATQTVQQTISSLTVNQLTFGSGAGWVQFGPLQASIVSSIQEQTNVAYINNLYIGTQSTVNSAQYNGLFGNYNNTVLAEISTGSGSQEFLVFKGSSASDRVRVQTTGNFVVETGVSSRLWNSNTTQTLSNTTPAFIINTSSNVGIQTASPATTLDVAGTGRFQVLSTLNINVSTINGLSFGAPINSTVIGLGSAGYISTAQLVSTTAGLVDHLELTSSIAGLGSIGYISSLQLVSTTAGLIDVFEMNSSIAGLGSAGYISSLQLVSTTAGLIDIPELTSSIAGLGSAGYISSLQLVSTTAGLIDVFEMNSSIAGLGSAGYISSLQLVSTTAGLIQIPELTSSIAGLGTAGYISTLQLASTIAGLGSLGYVSSVSMFSSITGSISSFSTSLGLGLIANTQSTVRGLGSAGYLSSLNGRSISTGTLSLSSLIFLDGNTGLQNSLFVSSGILRFNSSTLIGIYPSDYVCQGRLTANESIIRNTDTVLPFVSDFDPQGWLANAGSSSARFQPTLAGYYIVSFQVWWDRGTGADQDNVQIRKNGNTIAINQNAIPTVTGLSMNNTKLAYLNGTTDYIDFSVYSSTSDPTQTVFYGGTGDAPGTFFSASLVSGGGGGGGGGGGSGVSQIVAGSNVSIDPVGGTGVVTINATGGGGGIATIPLILSTSAIFTSSILASTMTTSSLQVNSLTIGTGSGWVNLGPLQTVAISSIQANTNTLYATTANIGFVSTLNSLQYNGPFGNYNNTVLAETSTGAGIQELLFFKGSTTTDRFRFQTTGTFVVETGVSTRLWNCNTTATLSNITPAFLIDINSNVGIQTNTPGANLDVAGTGRFVTASSVSMYAGAFYGGVFFL